MTGLPARPRLKAERERKGLSAQKAADQLHLDAWVIDALEAGDYARIGPSVYAKGHLKNYAALLGLSAAELTAERRIRRLLPPRSGRPWFGARRAGLQSRGTHAGSGGPAGPRGGVVEALASHRDGSPRRCACGGCRRSTRCRSPQSGLPADDAGPTSPSRIPRRVHERRCPTLARSPPESAANPGALGRGRCHRRVGRARLRLSFSADSWVDVRDARGNKYVGNGRPTRVKSIAGQAPMHVYLRSGSGVQLEVNDRAVAIGPQFLAGDVARFEAGADGVLRRDSSAAPRRRRSASARPPG